MFVHERAGHVGFVLWLLASGARGAAADAPAAAAAIDLFESRVRPVLVESCFGCHGADKQRGGLRLDSRDALLKGSDAGPIVFMGDPDKSPMVLAIRRGGEIKMPPQEKLPEEAIEAIAEWIKIGAPWPRSEKDAPAAAAAVKPHWAFQPVADPPAPAVGGEAWCASAIDRHVVSRLEAHQLEPSPRADRRTLLRRAAIDLTGLPPTVEEVESFLADDAPDAFERRVDALLASPRYGERWGRRWLDVARYADTKGYVFQEERRYPYAYTYRDYVIRAWNEDLPYDRFILEQLAADLLPRGDDNGSLAAMGFLTLGRRFLNNQADIIDDRIDLVSRGLMGLTVSCARCHDHKFDPIPSADYYSLYGVFASSTEPGDLPLIGKPEDSEAYRAFEKGLEEREGEVQKFLEAKRGEVNAEIRKRAAEYLLASSEKQPERRRGERRRDVAAGELIPLVTARWQDRVAEAAKAHDPVLAPWHRFLALSVEERAAKGKELAAAVAANGEADKPIAPAIAAAFAGEPPATLKDVAARYGQVFAAAEAAPDNVSLAPVCEFLRGEKSPANIPLADIERFINRDMRNGVRELRSKVERWKATAPGAPPRAMSLAESPTPTDPRIFIRGNASNPGKEVPRQFLAILTKDRKPFERGSGRLEMAQAIASPDNPLTARVIVNRIWMYLVGEPIVRTPGDFGTRCDAPTHPELLDHLASRLIEDRWSLKRLQRRILLSSVYQQTADDRPHAAEVDPEDRLLWKAHRRRLDFEALRDSLLAASGNLDLRLGGAAVDLTTSPFTGRRSIYGFIDRQNLPGLFRTFDFASPDTTSPRRHETTVPQQALFLLNSPFAVEQAKGLASRAAANAERSPMDRVRELYRLGLGRSPDADELALGMDFVQRPAEAGVSLDRWERLAQALLLTSELAYLD